MSLAAHLAYFADTDWICSSSHRVVHAIKRPNNVLAKMCASLVREPFAPCPASSLDVFALLMHKIVFHQKHHVICCLLAFVAFCLVQLQQQRVA